MSDVIDKIPFAKVDSDLAIWAGFLEYSGGLALVGAVNAVHH